MALHLMEVLGGGYDTVRRILAPELVRDTWNQNKRLSQECGVLNVRIGKE